MSTSQLHDLYLAAYRDAARLFARGVRVSEIELARRAGSLSAVERVIAAFALHDATNGTPPRARPAFDRALAEGARALSLLDPAATPTSPTRHARSSPGARRVPILRGA